MTMKLTRLGFVSMRSAAVGALLLLAAALGAPEAASQVNAKALRVAPLPGAVVGQSATRLSDGRWMLIGGESAHQPLARMWIVDARTNQTIALEPALRYARSGHTATVLPDGSVLVIGGVGSDGRVVGTVERFDLVRA